MITRPASMPVRLSPREKDVIFLLSEGHTDHEIAHELKIKITSVRTYIQFAREKLNARNRTHLVAQAFRWTQFK